MSFDPVAYEVQRKKELRRLDAIERINEARSDWRLSAEIAKVQGRAAALAISDRLEDLAGEEMNTGQITQDPEAGKAAWVAMASTILADAILAENRKHYDEIQAALAELRKDALTDEEIEELMS